MVLLLLLALPFLHFNENVFTLVFQCNFVKLSKQVNSSKTGIIEMAF